MKKGSVGKEHEINKLKTSFKPWVTKIKLYWL